VRLAILDDHEVLLDSLGSWIGSNAPDFEVVLMAATWLQLVHSPAFPTDLVFIDFQLKEPVSIEARVRTCRAAGARVMVLSSVDTREARERALAAGRPNSCRRRSPMAAVMDAPAASWGWRPHRVSSVLAPAAVGASSSAGEAAAQPGRGGGAAPLRVRIQHRRGSRSG
jgi:DNA-binding NarL/FixJ family response regulator